jgi:hypothetical protein
LSKSFEADNNRRNLRHSRFSLVAKANPAEHHTVQVAERKQNSIGLRSSDHREYFLMIRTMAS